MCLSCSKSITEHRVVCLTKPYSDVMTNLILHPFRVARLVGFVPGVKTPG